jgi:hypothetical protein
MCIDLPNLLQYRLVPSAGYQEERGAGAAPAKAIRAHRRAVRL